MSHLSGLGGVISHNPTRILTKEKEERGACKYNLKQFTYGVHTVYTVYTIHTCVPNLWKWNKEIFSIIYLRTLFRYEYSKAMATDYYLQLILNNNSSIDSRACLNFGIVHSCAPKVLRPDRRFYVTYRLAGLDNRYQFKVASSVYKYIYIIIIYITIIIYLSEPKASIFTNYNTILCTIIMLRTHSFTLRNNFFWFSRVVCVRRLLAIVIANRYEDCCTKRTTISLNVWVTPPGLRKVLSIF